MIDLVLPSTSTAPRHHSTRRLRFEDLNRIDSKGIPTKHTNHTKLNSSDGSWLGDSHLSVLELNDPTHGVIGFFRAFRVFRGLLGLHDYD